MHRDEVSHAAPVIKRRTAFDGILNDPTHVMSPEQRIYLEMLRAKARLGQDPIA